MKFWLLDGIQFDLSCPVLSILPHEKLAVVRVNSCSDEQVANRVQEVRASLLYIKAIT